MIEELHARIRTLLVLGLLAEFLDDLDRVKLVGFGLLRAV